ncbi:GyrI-like domain-containing protein [Promicromonospora sp. NPDC050880]|uniref:GyrI-like domain-containing protein n=1 Tax=Promicromonospora sp. NPDC050880 TaxID=3364406 RepID=UPI0037A8D096
MADKVDLKKSLDGYRAQQGRFRLLDVPDQQYLMVDGHGDPNTPVLAEAVEALYPVAYALKFASRRDLGRDFVVMPLEGLWWARDMNSFTVARDKSRWDWTLMILQPDWIRADAFGAAVEHVRARSGPARLDDVRLAPLSEGRCVQTLHVGSFDDEAAVLARMHDEFVPGNGLRPTGRHHEIYLSDFRRVPPERRRTILRQPVEAARDS